MSFESQSRINKILIVDDLPDNLHLLTVLLEEQGYEVRRALDGQMALMNAPRFQPDLILLDIRMPEMDGYEVCRRLKTHKPTGEIPVIFLSALGESFDKVKAFEVGGADYITKPFQPSEILARIKNQLQIQNNKYQLLAQQAQIQAQNQQLKREIAERQQAEQKYRNIFENAIEGIFQCSLEGRYLSANPALARIYGYDSPEELMASIANIAQQVYVHPDRHAELYRQLEIAENISQCESQVYRKDGSIIWISENIRVVRGVDGGVLYYEGSLENITNRKRIEQMLFQEKELAQVTLQSIGDAVMTTDAQGRVTNLNPIAEQLTGWKADEAKGRPLSEVFNIIHEVTHEPAENPVEKVLREGQIVSLTNHTVLIARDRAEYAIEDSAAPIRDRDGQLIGAVMVFHDVTQSRQLSRQLSWQATHDALTGLLNRKAFEEQLKELISNARSQKTQHALCYLDLDRFKMVNDTCGHTAGDHLLCQIARLLREHTRSTDTVARLGGDEFGVLLYHCPLSKAKDIAEAFRQSIQKVRFTWQSKVFTIGSSIGVAAINETSGELASVLNAADAACYVAKERGRNSVHIFQNNDRELARHRDERQWIFRLKQALEENRFCLYGQQIVPIIPGLGKVHYEVLLRLIDEDGNLVPPMAFIPAAERFGLMPEIDRWVIRTFLEYLANHQRSLPNQAQEPFRMYAINLSGASLSDDQFLSYLKEQLLLYPDASQTICFEITETTAIADLSRTAYFIRELRQLGCCFALDDFGSGMSSFIYLKHLPVDFLKIDGHFVKDIVEDSIDYAMVECINRVAHVTGTKTIAEFVENEAILEKLRVIGVDYAQGYGIAKPQPLFNSSPSSGSPKALFSSTLTELLVPPLPPELLNS